MPVLKFQTDYNFEEQLDQDLPRYQSYSGKGPMYEFQYNSLE